MIRNPLAVPAVLRERPDSYRADQVAIAAVIAVRPTGQPPPIDAIRERSHPGQARARLLSPAMQQQ